MVKHRRSGDSYDRKAFNRKEAAIALFKHALDDRGIKLWQHQALCERIPNPDPQHMLTLKDISDARRELIKEILLTGGDLEHLLNVPAAEWAGLRLNHPEYRGTLRTFINKVFGFYPKTGDIRIQKKQEYLYLFSYAFEDEMLERERLMQESLEGDPVVEKFSCTTVDMPDHNTHLKQIQRAIDEALKTLDKKSAEVVRLHSGLNDKRKKHTFKEIGERYELGGSRMQQIYERAIEKLRHPLAVRILRTVFGNEGEQDFFNGDHNYHYPASASGVLTPYQIDLLRLRTCEIRDAATEHDVGKTVNITVATLDEFSADPELIMNARPSVLYPYQGRKRTRSSVEVFQDSMNLLRQAFPEYL